MSDNSSSACLNTPSYSRSGSKAPSTTRTLDHAKSSHASAKALDIVLLGEIGVGKSSLVNLIVGKNVAGVSSDTMACTEDTACHTLEGRGKAFTLYDTPGLVDPQMGIESFIDPIDKIQQLLRQLNNGKGPDLLLFCVDNTKPTTALKRNYRLFSKVICGGRVPSALVITKLAKEQTEDSWWSEHGATIKKYDIDCAGYIGFRCRKSHNADMDEQLRASFMSFFVSCTDRRKPGINSLRFSVGKTVGSVTSFLRFRASTRTPGKVLTNQCGLDEQIARELAKRLDH